MKNIIFVFLFITINENINCLELGKLAFGSHADDLNLVELKSNNPSKANEVLAVRFSNATVSSVKTGTINFSRNTTWVDVKELDNKGTISHYSLTWMNPSASEEFCILFGKNAYWYSTYEEKVQRWPINKAATFGPAAFATSDFYQTNLVGDIIENLWISSLGFAVYVDKFAPLFVRQGKYKTDEELCFSINPHKTPFSFTANETKMDIHLIAGKDIKEAYQYAAGKWIKKPTGIPDERMFKSPIWSTWVKYKAAVDQAKVLEFAKAINSHGFPVSQIEIDDKWEPCYGEFTFDTKKFPNAQDMVKQLHDLGFRVTLWVYPFVNNDCNTYKTGADYFIKNKNNQVVTTKWWNGNGAYVDFTNPKARDWYVDRLNKLRNSTGLDSYKFDAGELGYAPADYQLYDAEAQKTPNVLTQLYVETAARLGNKIEVRVGFNSQHVPVFVRMLDKYSSWDFNNGLQTLITTALQMSIAGYPFVLPDMIGGNAYGNTPSKELFIRWIEVNALMPSLQFSLLPWDFGNSSQEVIDVTKKMIKLHEDYTPLIVKLANDATKTGEPIIRPLWWVAPTDEKTFTVEDEFLVGNDLLVAPITTDAARKRNIYLPSGDWKDPHGKVYKGPQTITDYPVNLDELPYFTRQ